MIQKNSNANFPLNMHTAITLNSFIPITPTSSSPSSPLLKPHTIQQKQNAFQNIMPFTILATLFLIILGPLYIPNIYSIFLFLIFTSTTLFSTLHLIKFIKTAQKIKLAIKRGMTRQTTAFLTKSLYNHVIIIPNYKEPKSLLKSTLDLLAAHSQSKTNYIIVLAMEESELEAKHKIKLLCTEYKLHFKSIHGCIHPANIKGEARGKGSNVNHAVRWIAQKLKKQNLKLDQCIVTVGDSDSHYNALYFDAIEESMKDDPNRFMRVFCPPIFLGRNAHKGKLTALIINNLVPAPVRMTDAMWSCMVMQNLSNPRQISFPCSTYSMSMVLADRVNYWDTGYDAVGEDMHM